MKKETRGRPTTKGSLNKNYHTYSPEQEEFVMAVHQKQIETRVKFPPAHFYFDVMIELGYRKEEK